MTTREYFKQLLTPPASRSASDRRVWSIGLNTTWVPFFTAANVEGVTHMPSDALGAPLRLVREKDSQAVKFGQNGKPRVAVAKPISDAIKVMRENYAAQLQQYVGDVQASNQDAYQAEVLLAQEAGQPIAAKDSADLLHAIEMRQEQEASQKIKLAA